MDKRDTWRMKGQMYGEVDNKLLEEMRFETAGGRRSIGSENWMRSCLLDSFFIVGG